MYPNTFFLSKENAPNLFITYQMKQINYITSRWKNKIHLIITTLEIIKYQEQTSNTWSWLGY